MGRFGGQRTGKPGRGNESRRDLSKNEKKKKNVEDYVYYVGSNKQASDFETTNEFMINYIKRTYTRGNDIAEALINLEEPVMKDWKPTLKTSNNKNQDEKKREDKEYELDYKGELDEYLKRKREYEQNRFKAYAELWARCNKAMKGKIEGRTDYESKIYNDPIELIKAIK
jgi:hypothetical protein